MTSCAKKKNIYIYRKYNLVSRECQTLLAIKYGEPELNKHIMV